MPVAAAPAAVPAAAAAAVASPQLVNIALQQQPAIASSGASAVVCQGVRGKRFVKVPRQTLRVADCAVVSSTGGHTAGSVPTAVSAAAGASAATAANGISGTCAIIGTMYISASQQQHRLRLLQSPGLFARWRMHKISTVRSDDMQSTFYEHLLAGRVTTFELVYTHVYLSKTVRCFYTVLGQDVVFQETPLRMPIVHFSADGTVLELADAAAWSVIRDTFQVIFLPCLLVATVKTHSRELPHSREHPSL
jgi:hypothetical protein